ncbi:DUF4183 domain-containing protein [Paenibacillus jamilae]|uniref:DUF4183 domain-containing protein n=1 Tax=Paenibacillus jamilae TaxID=114136 RepID=UPI0009ECF1D1|nr:DUF4183 domain-containing protein [Paenibacillus jamilae]
MRRRDASLRRQGKRTIHCKINKCKKCKSRHPSKGKIKTGLHARKHPKLIIIHPRFKNTSAKRRRGSGQTEKQGLPGSAGMPGEAGVTGAPGVPGTAGAPGIQGPAGMQGAPGVPGPAGAPGRAGAPGSSGAQGIPGPPGAQGMPGPPGAQGIPGPSGAQGVTGPTGAQGITGPTGPAPDISNIEIVPTAERYFYFTPDPIESSVTIMADQFSVDGVQGPSQRFHVGSNSYANLYINGMLQERTLFSLTPSSLMIHLGEGETISSGTPIIVEIVQFSVRYSA